MPRSPLPADVQSFVRSHIPSVPVLEALLQLHRSGEAGLTLTQLARRLYLAAPAAEAILERLRAACLAVGDGAAPPHFRLDAADPAKAALVARVARCYESDLVAMTRLIHEGAPPPGGSGGQGADAG